MAALLAAAALAVITFAPAVDNQFVYDDRPIIVDNPLVNGPGPWYRFWLEPYWPRGVYADRLYRPLTIASFRANVVLAGQGEPVAGHARAFHIVNVAIHALTSACVALLAWRVTRRPWAALLAGALFATHPLHTEAVVTGYGRSELLAGFFGVLLMARYIRPWSGHSTRGPSAEAASYKDNSLAAPADDVTSSAQPESRDPRSDAARFHALNALILLLALMSKEHSLFVWPVLILYDIWRFRRMRGPGRPSLRDWLNNVAAPAHAGFILAIATFFFFRFYVFGQFYRLEADRVRVWESPVAHATLVEHLLTPFRLLWLTLKLTVWPPALCPIWSIPALSLPNGLAPDVIAGMVLLVLIATLSAFAWRRGSPSGALLAGLLILLAIPVQALPMAHWLFAERWLYLPSVLMAVLVAAVLARVPVAGWALGLTAAVVLLPASWQYSSKFANNRIMNEEVVRRQPDNFQGRRNLAVALYYQGEYREAIEAAREVAERFKPGVSDPYWVILKSHLALGEGREALEAIDTYEWIRSSLPGPSLTEERQEAEALIARQASASRPAGEPHILRKTDLRGPGG